MFEYKPLFCSLCNNIQEDQSHVLRCSKCPERNNIRTKFKKELYKYLVNTNTNTTVTRVISYTINAWLNNETLPKLSELAPDASPTLKKAYTFQQSIGWENFFKGRLDIAWGEMYNYEKSTSVSNNNGNTMDTETWESKMLDIIWNFYTRNVVRSKFIRA
jgi:DNA-directed RNA polymerase subunit M/transcription elongation factor TFIIS